MEKIIAVLLLILLSPLLLIVFLLVKLTSSGPVIFKQKRSGKNKKTFAIYKIRTMVKNAEGLKKKLMKKNEADGPVFKIEKDPRYTKIGRWLSRTGIDELPQLINIIKGEMSFIGPRPLPLAEAKKVPKKYDNRYLVKPGITSIWVIEGARHNDFKHWMESDIKYVKNKNFFYDMNIVVRTLLMLVKLLWNNIF